MATESLEQVKTRLRAKYLGRAGIHGFGIQRSQNAVAVYFHEPSSEEQSAVLAELKRDATPCRVVLVREAPPKAHT